MSNDITGGLRNLKGGNIDALRGPYATVAAANLAIPNTVVDGVNFREGKYVEIGSAANFVTYWWKGGYADVNLVEYTFDKVSKKSVAGTVISNQIYNGKYTPDTSISSTGTPAVSVGAATTEDMPIDATKLNITLSGMAANTHRVMFFDKNLVRVGDLLSFSNTTRTLSIPATAEYVRIFFKAAADPASVLTTFMINYGTTILVKDTFQEELKSVEGKEIPKGISMTEVSQEIDQKTIGKIDKSTITMYASSNQKYNKNSVIRDKGISSAGGYSDSPGSAMTDLLPVSAAVSNFYLSGLTATYTKRMIYFNSLKVRISPITTFTTASFSIAKPEGCAYVQIWFKAAAAPEADVNSFVLNFSSTALPLDEYKDEVSGIDGRRVFTSEDLGGFQPDSTILPSRLDHRYISDFSFKQMIAESARLHKTVQSLRKIKTSGAGEININIPNASGVAQSDVNLILNLHYGAKVGDTTTYDFFMNSLCAKDFSDIRFLDSTGNMLEAYKAYSGNYEMLIDRKLKTRVLALSDGTLIGNDKESLGIVKSINNAVSWVTIFPTGTLVGIAQDNIFFSIGLDFCKANKSNNYADYKIVIAGDATDSTWRANSFAVDDAGNIYMGKYQTVFDAKIYKSTDQGETFNVIYTAPTQHIHAIVLDKSVTPNIIYADMDGNVGNAVSYPRTVKSLDRGVTWVELKFGDFTPDYGVLYADKNVRIGGGEGQIKGYPTIYRTTDDKHIEVVMDNSQNLHQMNALKGAIYAIGNSHGANKYPRVFRSTDEGKTWGTALDSGLIIDKDLSCGYRYGSYGAITPTGDVEHMILCPLESYFNVLPALRVFEGGDHYQATFYVKVPTLPIGGLNIKIGYGYLAEDVEGYIFNDPKISDIPIVDLPLNEFTSTVLENVEKSIFELPKSSWIGGITKQYAFVWPKKSPVIMAGLKIDSTEKISLKKILYPLDFNKGFTVNFWHRLSDNFTQGQSLKQFLFGRIDSAGNELFFYRFNYNRIGIRYNGLELTLTDFYGLTNADNFHMITLQVTNDTVPIFRAYISGLLYQEGVMTGFNNNMQFSDWVIGGLNGQSFGINKEEDGFITDFKIYPYVLNEGTIKSMFQGGSLLRP